MVGNKAQIHLKHNLETWRRTKIITTVGRSDDNYENIESLVTAGVDGFKLNVSRSGNELVADQVKWIKSAAADAGKQVAIILDLSGPRLTIGDFDGIINIERGQSIRLEYNADYGETGHVPTRYDLSDKVKRGERILLFNGRLHAVVTSVKGKVVYIEAVNSSILLPNKSIHLPDTDLAGDIITPKDRQDLLLGSMLDIDYVTLNCIQSADDIKNFKKLLRGMNFRTHIIAKIETRAALNDLESILSETDVVEISADDLIRYHVAEEMPLIQRQIIGLGRQHMVPTIIDAQLLMSMGGEKHATTIELSEAANAVLLGSDALTLGEAVAAGQYHTESVKTLQRVIKHAQDIIQIGAAGCTGKLSIQSAITEAIVGLALSLEAKAIVAETKTGATAKNIAAKRETIRLIAVTNNAKTASQLAIVFAVEPYYRPTNKLSVTSTTDWLKDNHVLNRGDMVVVASGKYPGVVGTTDTIKVRLLE